MKKLLLSLIIITAASSLYSMESLYDTVNSPSRETRYGVISRRRNPPSPKASADKAKTDNSNKKRPKLSPIILPQILPYHAKYLKYSSITLPQIYFYLANLLSKDVAKEIFSFQLSLQPELSNLNEDISCLDDTDYYADQYRAANLQEFIRETLKKYGYYYTSERLSRNLERRGLSICDVRNGYKNGTVLHCDNNVNTVKFFLQFAGRDAWKLLAIQNEYNATALYEAASSTQPEIVELLLNTAGNNAWTLLTKQTTAGYTALHTAASSYGYGGRENIIKTVKLLLNAAGNQAQTLINIPNKYGKTAFDIVQIPEIQEIMLQYLQK